MLYALDKAARLLVATFDVGVRVELAKHVALLAKLTNLDEGLCEVAEEQILVLRVGLDPDS